MTERIPLSGDDWLFKDYIGEDWLWRNAHRPDTHDVAGWQRGTVPGSVQHDLWQAGCIPDPYFERNSLLIERVLARTWLYKKSFTVGEEYRGCRVQLHFAGVDYAGRFYLNGELLGQHQGMFTPASFEVGDRLAYGAENLLCVVIDPAPAEEPQVGYSSRVRTHKARMNYWWDFCPRMIHLGIWDEVALEVTGPVRVEDVFVQAHLADDFSSAEVSISTELSALEPTRVDVETIVLYEGQPLACDRSHHALGAGRTYLNTCLPVIGPELWWPNKYGSQPLYEVEVSVTQAPDGALLPAADTSQNLFTPATEGEIVDNVTFEGGGAVSDQRRVTFGIRKVQMVANETPDSTAQPYTFVVNGRKLYAKGWNWVPLDALYGVERPEKLAHLLELACRANVNLLRVWGGGLIEREAFYDLCDRHGILVWQEFVQSSSGIENTPPNDPAFVAMMTAEARQILPLRRNHPSLVIWCGGNELMDAPDRPVDDERAPVLAALHAAVRELDPERHWLPASPAGRRATNTLENIAQDPLGLHDVHGPWEH